MNKMLSGAIAMAFSAALMLGGWRIAHAEVECMSQDEATCKAEKDERVARYAKGREAYEIARTAGDFSEAYTLSRGLALVGDKNGERLLKMVYMQLGWGAHRDYVQAYGWLSEGIADGEKYLVTWREKLIAKMTPEQLAQAKKTNSN
jgi:hypothetical protein